LTGILALGAAYVTIRQIDKQINLQKTQFDSEKFSKHWAARARVIDALSAICLYSVRVMSILRKNEEIELEFPIEAIKEIKDIIQEVEEKASKQLFLLLTKYQVQVARLRSHLAQSGRGRRGVELQDRYYDVVELRAIADSLFDYARNEVSEGPTGKLTSEAMLTSLRTSAGLSYYGDESAYQGVMDKIARRHAGGESDDGVTVS
jgi:hypothetical protein